MQRTGLIRRAGLLVLAGVTSWGCGISTTATFLREPPGPITPRPAESVEIYSAGRPTQPHVDLAFIESEQLSTYTAGDTPEIIADMREQAGRLGCDALVLGSTFFRVDDVNTLFSGDTRDRKGLSGTCIVYTRGAKLEGAEVSRSAPRP